MSAARAPGTTGPAAAPTREGSAPVLALDIGGTKLAAAVVHADGAVASFAAVPTHAEQGPDAVLGRLLDLGRAVCVTAGIDPAAVAAAGIGCGGPLDPVTGVVSRPPALPDWDDVPVTDTVSTALGVPAFLENDATAGALGEFRWANPDGVANLVYLTVSTGMGGGTVVDGRLFRGAAGNGGEPGHVLLDWRGRPCGCGSRGCAEAYVSGAAIGRRAREAVAAGVDSSLARLADVSAADVSAAAAAGDRFAGELWAESMEMLGRVVGVIVNVWEPDLVVLGGGVTRAGAMFLDPVRRTALAHAMPPAAARARIVLSPHGDRAGVLGAAAVAFDRLAAVAR